MFRLPAVGPQQEARLSLRECPKGSHAPVQAVRTDLRTRSVGSQTLGLTSREKLELREAHWRPRGTGPLLESFENQRQKRVPCRMPGRRSREERIRMYCSDLHKFKNSLEVGSIPMLQMG